MKESLLKKMIAIVDGTISFSKADFYKYDLAQLCRVDGDTCPFFWSVRETGTCLLTLDYERMLEDLRHNSVERFQFMRDPTYKLNGFLYFKQAMYFRYDGNGLSVVNSTEEYRDLWGEFAQPIVDKIYMEFGHELQYWRKPINVRFASVETAHVVWNGLHGEDGEGLLKLLQSFHTWERGAISDEVVISRDWNGTDLLFSHNRDGHQVMCGGILFYDGKWHRHT